MHHHLTVLPALTEEKALAENLGRWAAQSRLKGDTLEVIRRRVHPDGTRDETVLRIRTKRDPLGELERLMSLTAQCQG